MGRAGQLLLGAAISCALAAALYLPVRAAQLRRQAEQGDLPIHDPLPIIAPRIGMALLAVAAVLVLTAVVRMTLDTMDAIARRRHASAPPPPPDSQEPS